MYCSCGLDDLGFYSWQWQEIFCCSSMSRLALGPTQPSIQWVPWFFLNMKWMVMEVCHSHPYCARLRLSGAVYAVVVWTGTALSSPSSGCKFSYGGRAPTKQLNAASCMESLSKINVGWDLTWVLKVVELSHEKFGIVYQKLIVEYFAFTGCCWSHG